MVFPRSALVALAAASFPLLSVAHMSIFVESMYGIVPNWDTDTLNPVAPLGPNWATQDEWWFRSFGVTPTIPGSPLDACPGQSGPYHSGEPNIATIDDSLLSGCALGIADVDDIEDTNWDNIAIFSVQQQCVKQKVTSFEIPEKMPACTGEKCICAWFWLANNGTGNFYMTAFDCKITNVAADATPIMKTLVDPITCKDNSSCTYPTGAKRPIYTWNEPYNVLSPGNDNRPGYHDDWGFADGAQNDIFEPASGHDDDRLCDLGYLDSNLRSVNFYYDFFLSGNHDRHPYVGHRVASIDYGEEVWRREGSHSTGGDEASDDDSGDNFDDSSSSTTATSTPTLSSALSAGHVVVPGLSGGLLAVCFGMHAKIARALKATKNAGLQQALDWLQDHADDPEPAEGEEEDAEMGDEEVVAGGAEAKSLKCLECGKIFRNQALASYHGEKSGHDQFEESTEEIKPLTEEEKTAKLAELRQRMLEKKAIQAKKDAEEAKANEAIRRKGGKDSQAIKAELQLKEAQKEALQRKKDKIDDAKAKAAVKAQIEADKKARAEQAAKAKALREGTALPSTSEPAAAPAVPKAETKKDYDSTRLQIRLAGGGQPLVHSTASTSTLGEVVSWIQEQGQTVGGISSAFPRKTYSSADYSKTMQELGLAPSAVLMLS
ncbi:Galactose-binding domain-like protein [Pseudohyphozyma bogoriensis]|nr:Galactose-binding domain-like protein [Pseudohyphozyma bogoriensis]